MTKLSIPEMSCGHCKATIEKTIMGLDPAAALDFDMTARVVAVKSSIDIAVLRQGLEGAGYPSAVV